VTETETVAIGDAFDRVDADLDRLVAQLSEAESGAESARMLSDYAKDREAHLEGVAVLREAHGADATVTVRAVRAGAFAQVEDRVADLRATHDGPGDLPGARRNVWVATALVEAPFIDAGADYEARLDALAAQHVGVVKWLEHWINEVTSPDADFRRLRERLAATSAASTE